MVTAKATIEITAGIPCPRKLMSPPKIRREDSSAMAFKNGALLDSLALCLTEDIQEGCSCHYDADKQGNHSKN